MIDEDSPKVQITYETLYEILRREKGKDELQKLDETFLYDALEYLKEKSRILQEAMQKHDIFSMDEKESTQMQLTNIKKIIKELYERREKKIIDLAMNKSRTRSNIINTENLLTHEYDFFNIVIKAMDEFREDILLRILALQEPKIKTEYPKKEEKQAEPAQEDDESEQESEVTGQKPEPMKEPLAKMKKVRFVQKIDQFVGKELEFYGPYEPEQTADLPDEIADVLIGKGDAVCIE